MWECGHAGCGRRFTQLACEVLCGQKSRGQGGPQLKEAKLSLTIQTVMDYLSS